MEDTKHGLVLVTLDMVEQLYSLPVEEREAALAKMVKERKAQYLGHTDKTAPELAVDLIKHGVKTKSYSVPPKKGVRNDK